MLRYEGVFNFSRDQQLGGGAARAAVLALPLLQQRHRGDRGRAGSSACSSWASSRDVGIVGAKLLYPDRKTIQHGGVCVGAFGAAEHYGKRAALSRATRSRRDSASCCRSRTRSRPSPRRACSCARMRSARSAASTRRSLVGFGDVDLCLRVACEGLSRHLLSPRASCSTTSRTRAARAPSIRIPRIRRSTGPSGATSSNAGDPYYSPGLSLTSTSWSLKQPLHCDFGIRRRIVRRTTDREELTFSAAELAA